MSGALRARREDERGYATLALVLTMLVLLAGAAIAVDVGAQWYACDRCEGDIELFEEELKQPGRYFLVINDDEPACALATQAVESLRAKGEVGEVDVWYWEAPVGSTWTAELGGEDFTATVPETSRVAVYGIYCGVERVSLLGGALFGNPDGVTKASAAKFYAVTPYASESAWTPEATARGGAGIVRHYWSEGPGDGLHGEAAAMPATKSLDACMGAFAALGSADGRAGGDTVAARMGEAAAGALWKYRAG